MTVDNMTDLYPVPFPDDAPIANLEKISLYKLLNDDEDEAQRLFKVCKETGFFYLDMMDHPKGKQMWEDACTACRAGQDVLPRVPMQEKKLYKAPAGVRVLDQGYQTGAVKDNGRPRDSEMFMVPQTGIFGKGPTSFQLPSWLAQHEGRFKAAMKTGNTVANIVLSVLETELQLPQGAFTSLHRLADSSGDFLRVLRYPGSDTPEKVDPLRFPAHKDAVSVAILFTWLGGLQIVEPQAAAAGVVTVPEDSWRWVKPLPGCAVVNLGDAMEVFTNGVLKSGLHRVIKAPGQQRVHDKYSVLIVARPEDQTPMKAFKSPMIPEDSPEQARAQVFTSIQWGNNKIKALQDVIDKIQSERRGKSDKLERSW
ncbi:MAG: hypothetical protein Q9188_004203 [Gyalolechia gomerana]